MIHTEEIQCPYCENKNLQKNGKSSNGLQRWYCKQCGKYFQREYVYNAWKHGIKEKIIELTLNSSGVRDIGRVLKISKDTVVSVLKKNATHQPLLSPKDRESNI
jgi:transposase-like protein